MLKRWACPKGRSISPESLVEGLLNRFVEYLGGRMETGAYDIILVGAGPAGTSAALALKGSGLKVALLDKATFPRDKICGDLVAGQGIRALREMSPGLAAKLAAFPEKAVVQSTRLYIGDHAPMQFDWVLQSYVMRRTQFDALLLEEVLETGETDFYGGDAVQEIIRTPDGFRLVTKGGRTFSSRLVIGADGAHSVVAKSLAGYKVDREHYGGSVRAYFTGVENIRAAVNEVYVHRKVIPGYFWLFPVSDTAANVGIGMHSRHITRNKVDLKDLFYQFMEESPVLQQKLGNATQEGSLSGFGLPFFSKRFTLSGDGYLLAGDAGSMVDPSNGEGIMLAIISGQLAAETARQAFEKQDFSAAFLHSYTRRVHDRWWKEMRAKAWLVNTFGHRYGLLDRVGGLASRSPRLKFWIQKFL